MKNRISTMVIIGISIAFLAVSYLYIVKIYDNKTYNNYSDLWLIYDNNVETIKNNMDIIATEHEKFPWGVFKDTYEIPTYKEKLDRVVNIITDCYVDFAGLSNIYTKAGTILKYRNSTDGIDEDSALYRESMCTSEFNIRNFSDYTLDNEINSYSNLEEIIKEIREFDSKYGDTYQSMNFRDYLVYKVNETTYISKLTNALVIEYYNLNNGGNKYEE